MLQRRDQYPALHISYKEKLSQNLRKLQSSYKDSLKKMNYSDYDSDGYSSNEDADYVPSDGSLSEDDINECEKEDPLHEDDEVPHPSSVHKNKKKKDKNVRKRKKGILKLDNTEEDNVKVEEDEQPQEKGTPSPLRQEDEAKLKKKSDDLWASFLSDVGSRPKQSMPATDSDTTLKGDSEPSTVKTAAPKTETKPSEPAKVTITKVFDFAGEEVRVNKEVAADSKEAKSFLKSQMSAQEDKYSEKQSSSPGQSSAPAPSVKRTAGLSGVLGRIGGKKQKMSTLEKSKMDWDAFKSEEGINEELAIHNRGREGYVERKNFLERVDHRQFELEKTVRLSNMKQ